MSAVFPDPPLSSPPATVTPGQAAHKAFWDAVGPELVGQPREYTWETSTLRDHWERAARAAIDHDGQPDEAEAGRRAYETWVAELDKHGVGCDVWHDQDGAEQAAWAAVERRLPSGPAPELAAALAELAACRQNNAAIAVQLGQYRDERDELRALVAEILDEFGTPYPGKPPTANSAHLGRLADWRKRAGLEAPDGG